MRSALLAASALVVSSLVVAPAHAVESRPAPLGAVGGAVTVANMAFGPTRVTVRVGQTVTWTFEDAISHSATSDNGFFDTGLASSGQQRTVRFRSSGTFAYHCRTHPHMTGKVKVPVTVSGSRADGWRLQWRAGDNLRNRSYDVQVRRVGTTTWRFFRRDTTQASGRFDPGRGTWQVRARTWKGAVKSGWSPTSKLP